MIPETEIFARLTALHTALVEKLGAQPYLSPSLHIADRDCRIAIYDRTKWNGGASSHLHSARSDTIEGALADAEAFVAAMPDPEAKAKHDWHRKLGDVIDEGHDLALPDDVMEPLRGASKAMHKNLLDAPT